MNTSAQESEGDTCTVAIFEEVTRNDAFLYVTACTLLRPHFLPLVAAHLVVAEEPQASALNPCCQVENFSKIHLMHVTLCVNVIQCVFPAVLAAEDEMVIDPSSGVCTEPHIELGL